MGKNGSERMERRMSCRRGHAERKKRHVRNGQSREAVTGRMYLTPNGLGHIFLSIGKHVCEVLEWGMDARVGVFRCRQDGNFLILRKCGDPMETGYKLNHSFKSNFLTFKMPFNAPRDFCISQTMVLAHDIRNEGTLFIDLGNMANRSN